MTKKEFFETLKETASQRPELKENAVDCLCNAFARVTGDYYENQITKGVCVYALWVIKDIASELYSITDADYDLIKTGVSVMIKELGDITK